MLEELRQKRLRDRERFLELDMDECQLCGAEGEDKRSLYLSMFYAVDEAIPEAIDLSVVNEQKTHSGYFLRICKACRAGLLGHLKTWAEESRSKRHKPMDSDGHLELPHDTDRNIPIREHGAIVWLTRAEWDERMKPRD